MVGPLAGAEAGPNSEFGCSGLLTPTLPMIVIERSQVPIPSPELTVPPELIVRASS